MPAAYGTARAEGGKDPAFPGPDRAVPEGIAVAAQPAATGPEPEFWRGRAVLVTGHTGFKGAWLALWLQLLGARVVGMSRSAPTEPSLYAVARVGEGDMVEVEADLRDFDAVTRAIETHRPEIVLHLAAQALVGAGLADPRSTFEVNVMGTVNVLEAVRRIGGVRAVVNVTSDKCYENREWDWGYREYEPKGGRDPYSSSKACSELVTAAFRESFFNADTEPRVATARAGNVIGGGDWAANRLVPDLMRAALDRRSVVVRTPHSVRPWQHVLEPVRGYLMLAQALCQSAGYAQGWNFGPPPCDERPVAWVVERTAQLWPARFEWTVAPPQTSVESRVLKLDSSRARDYLGWQPQWTLEEALMHTVAWFRAFEEGADMRRVTEEQIEAHGLGVQGRA